MKGHVIAGILLVLVCVKDIAAQQKSCGNVPSGVFIPNRANCKYFFLCVSGYLMQLQCSQYSVFDPIEQICSENCNAPPPITAPTTEMPTTTTSLFFTIPTAPTIGPPNTEDPCYGRPNNSYVAIPNSCKFLYCMNGTGITTQCPDGYCFDGNTNTCSPI